MRSRIWASAALLLWLAHTAQAQEENRTVLRGKLAADIERVVAGLDGIMGVAIKDLTSGEEILINEHLVFPTGSSIKIPILIELYKQAAENKFKLEDRRWVERKGQTGGSGVIQHFGDHTSQLSLRDLAVLMIVLSDNTATNMLIEQVGMESVNRTLDRLDLKQIRLRRRMIDLAASARGDENTATPREALRLMEMLYRGGVISRALSDEVLTILKLPKRTSLTRPLPPGVAVANKPGGLEGVSCEWGIVLVPNRPYAIAIMSNYVGGERADEAIAHISKLAYDYFARLARSTPYGARLPAEVLKTKP